VILVAPVDRPGVRQALAFFMLGGAVSFVSNRLPGSPHHWVADVVAACDVAMGLFAWRAPWDRWPRRATVVLALFALPLIAVPASVGLMPSHAYGACFVVVFAWIGMTQPPRTGVILVPPATVAYLVPLLVRSGDHAEAVRSAVVVLPICVLIAEVGAHIVAQLHEARSASERRADLLGALAQRDELTGVGNRRHATALLTTLRPGDTLVMVDLDCFKVVNDTHGHCVGDSVLRTLAQHLVDGVRDADLVARYGGDEFIVILRDARAGGALAARRLLQEWRATGPATSFSAGLALHTAGDTPESTLGRADASLYAAKQRGRDRVCEDPEIETVRVPVAATAVGALRAQ
jgi:diguanylate cyclase (GGDEF)-like protein